MCSSVTLILKKKHEWECLQTSRGIQTPNRAFSATTITDDGWGNTRHCLMQDIGDFSHPKFTSPSHIFNVIRQYLEVVNSLSSVWVECYRLHWEKSFPALIQKFNASDPYRTCRIARATGILFNGTWAVRALVTNLTSSDAIHERGYLLEDLVLREGRIVPFTDVSDYCAQNNDTEGGLVILTKAKHSWSDCIFLQTQQAPSLRMALQ